MNNGEYPENREIRTLNDKAYDLLGEMLLEQEAQAILAALEEEENAGNTADMDAFFARRDAKTLEKINRHFRKRRTRTFFYETLPKIGQAAAVIIAVITVAGGVAIAASHTVRVQVMKLLTRVEEEYTELSLVEDTEASFDVPAEWEGEYYPSYIPEGMDITSISVYPGFDMVDYADSNDITRRFSFSENGEGSVTNVDTENAALLDVTVNGSSGIISKKDQTTILYWDNGKVYFILSAENLDDATVLQIAEGIMRIK